MNIRPFKISDTESVISLWEICRLTRPWNNPQLDIERKMAVGPDLFLVATDKEQIIGSVMGGYDGHRGWINYLAVHPQNRKQGLGRQLMYAVEELLLSAGCPKINLQVRHGNNDVIAFYQAIGFADDKCVSFGKRLIPDN